MQIAAVSVAVALGVFGSGLILKNVLMERALNDELTLYSERLDRDPNAPPPHTYNLRGYFWGNGQASPALPAAIRDLEVGVHHLRLDSQQAIVSVSQRPDGRVYLIFAEENVLKLALVFGLVPLTLLLTGLYTVVFWTYRMSHRAVSPIVGLAHQVAAIDLQQIDEHAFDLDEFGASADHEVAVLASALQQLQRRMQRFVQRERDFTRDASHELRTPITVIQMACGLLLEEGHLDSYGQRQAGRIQAAAREMQELIEALLVLAREGDETIEYDTFSVNELVRGELERHRFLLRNKPVEIVLQESAQLSVTGVRSAASVLLANLVRNACSYTDSGRVDLQVYSDRVVVADTGVGMSKAEVDRVFEPFYRTAHGGGHGIGLAIVKRLSERFGWPVKIVSERGEGTQATVYFAAP